MRSACDNGPYWIGETGTGSGPIFSFLGAAPEQFHCFARNLEPEEIFRLTWSQIASGFVDFDQTYQSIGEVDGVKVLVKTSGSVKAPEYSHTANRVYAVVQTEVIMDDNTEILGKD